MAKFFGFEINSKRLSAAFASVLGAFAVSTAAAQDPAPAADGPAPEVIAKGNIIKQIGMLGTAVLLYSDRSVKFEGGDKVPAGDHAFIGRRVDEEALFNSGLGTDTISKARNQWLGLGTFEVGTGGRIVRIENDPDMVRSAALAKPPSSEKPVATVVTHNGLKAGKPVAVSAKAPAETPVNEAVLGAEGNRVKSVSPVADAIANNLFAQGAAPDSSGIRWNDIAYDNVIGGALQSKSIRAPTDKETSVPAPMAQDTWSAWQQNVKDRFAQLGRLITGVVGLIGTLGLAAAFTSARPSEKPSPAKFRDDAELLGEREGADDQVVTGGEPATMEDIAVAFGRPEVTNWMPVTEDVDTVGDGCVSKGHDPLTDLGVEGELGNVPPADVVAALGGDPKEYILDTASGGERRVLEGEFTRITQVPTTVAPVITKDTGFDGSLDWPPSIPNLTEVAPFTAAITNACNKVGAPASGIGTEFVLVKSHDKGRHAEISPRVGGFYCDLSKGRFKLTVLSNEDGTLSIRASGEGLGRGKAPVEATLGADGKLVIDQETLAARKVKSGMGGQFVAAAAETFGAKAETVITRALKRAVVVIQAAPEPLLATVRPSGVTVANVATCIPHA